MSVPRPFLTSLLLLFCLAMLGSPLGMVLCVGGDGHIALEPPHKGAPHASSPTAQGARCEQTAPALAGMERHSPCIDVTLSASDKDGQLLPASHAKPNPELPKVVPVALAPVYHELPARSLLPSSSVPPHHSLTILRRMALRI